MLPCALPVVGSAASLAANVAVAQPDSGQAGDRGVASFALIGAYELLMRQVRCGAAERSSPVHQPKNSPSAKELSHH